MKTAHLYRYLVIIALFPTLTTFAQENKLTTSQFNSIFMNQFRMISGSEFGGTGAYAELDLEDAKVEFNPAFVFEDKCAILGFNFSGSASDGISTVFKDSDFNTAITFGSTFSFAPRSKLNTISFTAKEKEKFERNRKLDSLIYQLKVDSLNEQLQIDSAKLNIVNSAINELPDDASTKRKNLEDEKRGIEIVLRISELKLAKLNDEFEGVAKLNKDENMPISGISMNLFSFGINANYNKFKLFDPTMSIALQTLDTAVWSQHANARWTYFNYSKYSSFTTFYVSIGAKYSRTNNVNSLDKRQIRDFNTYPDSTLVRESYEEYVVYEGDFKSSVNRLTLSADFYYFLGKDKKLAAHLSGGTIVQDGLEPTYSCGIGLLAPLKKKGEDETLLNAELFYTLYDLTNSSKSSLTNFERSQVGLKFTFPINFQHQN